MKPNPNNTSVPHISATVIRGLKIPLSEHHLDIDDLLARSRISSKQIADDAGFVPLSNYLALLQTASELKEDPLFSLKLARSSGPETLGALGFLFLSSPTLANALENLARYVNLLQSTTNIQVYEDGDNLFLTYEIFDLDNLNATQDVQFSLGLIARLIKMYLGYPAKGMTLYHRHAPLCSARLYQEHIRADFMFNCDMNAVSVPKSLSALKGKVLDSSLAAILSNMLDKQLDISDSRVALDERVKRLIFADFSDSLPAAEEVAGRLGLSVATLHRYLRVRKTSFSKILDLKTFSVASEYLAHSHLNITEIALRCGYSESASFNRAFYRISGGKNPSEFRKAMRS